MEVLSTRSPVLTGFVFQSTSSSKSPYWPTEQRMAASAPVYLSSNFTQVTDVPSQMRLRSSTSDQLIVPSCSLASVGRRAFPVSAANLCNSLPAHLISAPSLTIFRQRLKTFLFRRFYPDLIIWHSEFTVCCGNLATSKNVVDDVDDWACYRWCVCVGRWCGRHLNTLVVQWQRATLFAIIGHRIHSASSSATTQPGPFTVTSIILAGNGMVPSSLFIAGKLRADWDRTLRSVPWAHPTTHALQPIHSQIWDTPLSLQL